MNTSILERPATPAPAEAAATKALVQEAYAEIAQGGGCGCGTKMAASANACVQPDYAALPGYVPEADLGLGCGVPTHHARLAPGLTVLDLGAGAGNDVFVARREVGESGHVIGVDFTAAMVAKARANLAKLGYSNVEFRLGEIEHLPVADRSVDVILSNCVLNLVPDKHRAFAEMLRVLRPGGWFCVSDIVLLGPPLPPVVKQAAEFYVGCVAGAWPEAAYVQALAEAGFESVEVAARRPIHLPTDALAEAGAVAAADAWQKAGGAVVSVTVRGYRPASVASTTGCCGEASATACCGNDAAKTTATTGCCNGDTQADAATGCCGNEADAPATTATTAPRRCCG